MGLLSTMIGAAILARCLLSYNSIEINFHFLSWEVEALKTSASQNSQLRAQWECTEGCGHLHLVQKSLLEGSEF